MKTTLSQPFIINKLSINVKSALSRSGKIVFEANPAQKLYIVFDDHRQAPAGFGVKASLTKKTYVIQRRVASSDRNVSEGRKPSSVLKVKVGNVFDFPNIDETRQVARQLVQTMLATKRNPNKIKRETDASELETVIKIVLHEVKPIHFATTVIALSSDRYLEMCDLYSSQALE
ncbi:cytoplasmic protein [Salmonella enterica]|uniref:Cytoplasmic protein n=1 Tax=Salmonella enterica TaxID=28901 RepID=A0A5U5AIG6_SALER|nr:cytoplasmic protein [Salmonella enterica]EAQ6077473.1 cytoplasmic protein [Salmonella enterica]EAW8911032.1 cytoplasmic protein [Salmonella enterica]EAX2292643.1 cytoplasmic protein [Salmonella enterica]EAX2312075.1 cytoplasmic protein [Salmonella enterica]